MSSMEDVAEVKMREEEKEEKEEKKEKEQKEQKEQTAEVLSPAGIDTSDGALRASATPAMVTAEAPPAPASKVTKKPKPPKADAEMTIEERIAAALAGGDTSAGDESSGMETGQSMTDWDDDDLAGLMD